MYWLANSGTKSRATAMMPAAAYSAAIASPSSSSTPRERRNGGISSRQNARNARRYFTRMPRLSSARLVASQVTAATAPASRRPTVS